MNGCYLRIFNLRLQIMWRVLFECFVELANLKVAGIMKVSGDYCEYVYAKVTKYNFVNYRLCNG